MGKILVTGATGFIGKQLVEALVREGRDVHVITRSPEKARRSLGLPVRCFAWDDAAAFEGVTQVVHLAGDPVAEGRWTGKKKERILRSRTDTTRGLVDAMLRSGGVESFVCASAVGYYGGRGDERLDEESRAGEGFLADVCKAWEAEAFRAQEGGVRTAALRIGMVLGKDGGALQKLLPVFRLGLGGKIGNGRQFMSWIHVEDVVGLILHALKHTDIRGPVNAVAPNPCTNGDFIRALGSALGRPTVFPVPPIALKIAMGGAAELAIKSQQVIPATALKSGYEFRYPTVREALAEICPRPNQRNVEVLEVNQWLDRPVEQVFPFFSDARNLEKLTPPWLNFRVQSEVSEKVSKGQHIDYRLRVHGLPLRWRSRIEEWNPNRFFVDTQVRGPYRLWHHTHTFTPMKGGTLIHDRVRYEVPGGSLGSILLGAFVRSDLSRIFAYRRNVIARLYGGSSERRA